MAQHRARQSAPRWLPPAVVVLTLVAVVATGALITWQVRDAGTPGGPASSAPCGRTVRVVTASSFEPVLASLAPALARGEDCVRLAVEAIDGRAAADGVARTDADVWIPDDVSWTFAAQAAKLAKSPEMAAGTVVASSPIYMVTDEDTAQRLRKAGGTWLALADLVARRDGVGLAVRDPAGSGDGMVGIGYVAEAVWLDQDMDASALWLSRAKEATRTVSGLAPALPERPGEVGLVPEYVLLGSAAAGAATTVLAGADRTALLRYTWQPTAAAVGDPARAAGLQRLLGALQGPAGAAALAAAHLRVPAQAAASGQPPAPGPSVAGQSVAPAASAESGSTGPTVPGDAPAPLPDLSAEPFLPLKAHHVDHVFATWYAADRRTSILVVVDVSGSMADPAPGTRTALIELVRQGCRSVVGLLPDDAQLGLWEFGSELAGKSDHRSLVSMAPLAPDQRAAWSSAVDGLAARRTGTGLYDTILAAYTTARDRYRQGVPNQVLILTDGRNEDDPGSLSPTGLAAKLREAKDPTRPVQLSVATFGQRKEAEELREAVQPVDGHLDTLLTPDEVAAVFIHSTAGGLHS